jgi:DMSO/TMAO reductase YedYZ heme-binding membrane subunit
MTFSQKCYLWFLNYGGVLWLLALWVFSDPSKFKDYGGFGMLLLNIIMLISPLATIFPRVAFFTKIKWLRKPLGIIAGFYMLVHAMWYFIHYSGFTTPISMVQDPTFWKLNNGLMWGTFASIISFLMLITSNAFSVKLLKEKWKYLHRLGHFLYIFVLLHVIFITGNKAAIVFFCLYLILNILVFFKVKF